MVRYVVLATIVALGFLTASGHAQTLPLSDNLVDLRSNQGEQLLRESDASEAFVPLSVNFVTQQNQAFCGVASIVMVLNAMQLPAPAVPEYDPYHTFKQDNFLDERTETILPRKILAHHGMTLDQLGALLATQTVEVEVRHAADTTLEAFRSTAASSSAGWSTRRSNRTFRFGIRAIGKTERSADPTSSLIPNRTSTSVRRERC